MISECLSDEHWSADVLIESDHASLSFDDVLNSIFRFRTLVINFMKGCPHSMLEEVYCGKVIASVLSVHCDKTENTKSLLNCVQKNGLVNILIDKCEDTIEALAQAATPL